MRQKDRRNRSSLAFHLQRIGKSILCRACASLKVYCAEVIFYPFAPRHERFFADQGFRVWRGASRKPALAGQAEFFVVLF